MDAKVLIPLRSWMDCVPLWIQIPQLPQRKSGGIKKLFRMFCMFGRAPGPFRNHQFQLLWSCKLRDAPEVAIIQRKSCTFKKDELQFFSHLFSLSEVSPSGRVSDHHLSLPSSTAAIKIRPPFGGDKATRQHQGLWRAVSSMENFCHVFFLRPKKYSTKHSSGFRISLGGRYWLMAIVLWDYGSSYVQALAAIPLGHWIAMKHLKAWNETQEQSD